MLEAPELQSAVDRRLYDANAENALFVAEASTAKMSDSDSDNLLLPLSPGLAEMAATHQAEAEAEEKAKAAELRRRQRRERAFQKMKAEARRRREATRRALVARRDEALLAAVEAERNAEATPRALSPAATEATQRSPARKKAKVEVQKKTRLPEVQKKTPPAPASSSSVITNYRQAKASASTVAKSVVGRLISWMPAMFEKDDVCDVPDCAGGLLQDHQGLLVKLKIFFTFGRVEEGTEEPGADLCAKMPKLLGKLIRLDGVGLRSSDWQEGSAWVTFKEKYVEGTHDTTVTEAVATTEAGQQMLDSWPPLPEAREDEVDEDGYPDYIASVVATPTGWTEYEGRAFSTVKYEMVRDDGTTFSLSVWSSVRDRRLLVLERNRKYVLGCLNHRRGMKAAYSTCAYSYACLVEEGEEDGGEEVVL